MYDNEVEAICNICRDIFYIEKNTLTSFMDKIVGVCEDCHEGYINGNSIPASHNLSSYNRLNDLS